MGCSYFQKSVLDIDLRGEDGKTVLKDFYFTSPFKVIKPFKQDNGFLRVMMMMASAGIMANDRQEINIHVGEGAAGELISQSYEKIHKMTDGHAERICNITVDAHAALNYMPQPAIPFADSAYKNHTTIHLKDETSQLVFHEIMSCGRVARSEFFEYTFYESLTKIFVGDKLIYRDNTKFDPKRFDMKGYGLFEGYTHLSNQVFIHMGDGAELCKKIRSILAEVTDLDIAYGVSILESGNVIARVLGHQGNDLELINQRILSQVLPNVNEHPLV